MEEHEEDYESLHDVAALSSSTSDRTGAQRSRKTHKKSRNGCQYCKQRRIKCDESKPVCGNCLRLSISCNYISPGSPSEIVDVVVRKRGRPRKDRTIMTIESDTASSEPTSTIVLTPSLASSTDCQLEKLLYLPWDAEDLELFNHYITQVVTGLGVGDRTLWRDRIPSFAFRHHGVLHLLIAVSALHLVRLDPSRSHHLEKRAEIHLAIGLRRASEILPGLNEDNCAELYVATILICIYTFAKKPSRQHLLVVSEGCEVAWWDLFRGVRIIVETIGIGTVFAGELGPLPSDVQDEETDAQHHPNFNIIEWEDSLARLSALVASAPKGVRDASQGAFDIMRWCFQETYGTTANPKPTVDAKFNTIMVWLYCLSDKFIGSLKEMQPVPLLLLAYFTVLLQTLDATWFMTGWAVHVLRGVSEILGSSWAEWLQWPTLQIERDLEIKEARKRSSSYI